MKRIGLLSDTHSFWDSRYISFFSECDEIWHAGDFGSMEIVERLKDICLVRGVYGNIDTSDIRFEFPEMLRFQCEGVNVLMKHIGGYPGRYNSKVLAEMKANTPNLFISGHSHILKVMMDKCFNCLHINPGAAGLYGQQPVRTLLRFVVDGSEIKDLEIMHL